MASLVKTIQHAHEQPQPQPLEVPVEQQPAVAAEVFAAAAGSAKRCAECGKAAD